jgi:membrane-bound ClpP family serine protease
MGANSQQGWSLLLFLIGFTFLPAGIFALGPIFAVVGLICLIASFAWFAKIKPLEHLEPGNNPAKLTDPARKTKATATAA